MSTTASTIALCFANVTKRYGTAAALKDFSLDVTAGQTFGLVGMNGAGKTTLIKCLLDFTDADSGAIEIFNTSNRITRSRASGNCFIRSRKRSFDRMLAFNSRANERMK